MEAVKQVRTHACDYGDGVNQAEVDLKGTPWGTTG